MPANLYNCRMQVCLFDIDGTLLSSGGAGKAAMGAALASAFGGGDSTDGVPFSGRTDRAICKDLFALHGVDATETNWQRFISAYLRLLPSYLESHRGTVLPGIASLLETLAQRPHMTLGLLTGNMREGARLKLDHYGIYHHFKLGAFGDHVYDRDEVARAALTEVRERIPDPVRLEDIWVIGDTPLDVQCARAIGASVLAVATGWHSAESLAEATPDLLFSDLSDPGLFLHILDTRPPRSQIQP
jgi:phosphoglycolate phosphatase